MSYDSAFAHIGENEESNQSVNPISTPATSSQTLIVNDTSNNGDNEFSQLPLHGRLGNEDHDNDLDRPRTLRERLALERMTAPSCIHIPPHTDTFHFRNEMCRYEQGYEYIKVPLFSRG